MVTSRQFPYRRPPESTVHRSRCVDSFGVPPALQDDAFVEAVKGTLSYQLAELRDAATGLAHAIRTEYQKGRQRSSERRPW